MEPTLHFRQLFRTCAYDSESDVGYYEQPEIQQLWKDPVTGVHEWRALPYAYDDEDYGIE
ncbi:hypothetical protein [Advenella kashmirensis]